MDSGKISVQTVNHLGIIAGLVDEIGLVELSRSVLRQTPQRSCQCRSGSQSHDYYSLYGGVPQKWVIVESEARKQADIKQIQTCLNKLEQQLNQQLTQLCAQDFRCEADALLAADRFAKKLKYHYLATVRVTKHSQHKKPGRPGKDAQPQVNYRLQATLALHQETVQNAIASSGRFVLATNVTDSELLTAEQVLLEYKAQQSPERGFRFLKDPLFFTNSIFVKSPERVAASAFVMGLCLLVYNLGQRARAPCFG
ncbi:MAG TPA: IS1634 family transposase [Oculatellaceae cyanobacterium]